MFVASLNLDLFFKKVFSNKRVAKKFLEDLLGVTITEIKYLSVENKITDESVFVKFDFRCKIKGQYVIIEMQQQYKIDVIKRFYMYHSVSTALQLETLKPIKLTKPNGETYTEKNYSGLEPVITIIWMVDDTLGFKEDFVTYSTLPEVAKDFMIDTDLWQQPLDIILEKRNETLKILQNKAKGLDFFTKNKLIYIFQKNIVKNKNVDLPYHKWFNFAHKSRNPNNREEDFIEYKKDKNMAEVISRLRKDKLPPEEFKYISDLPMYELYAERLKQDLKESKKMIDKAEQKTQQAEQKTQQAEQKTQQLEKEKQQLEQKTQLAEQKTQQLEQKTRQAEQKTQQLEQENQNQTLRFIEVLLSKGGTVESIAETLELGIEKTKAMIELIQN